MTLDRALSPVDVEASEASGAEATLGRRHTCGLAVGDKRQEGDVVVGRPGRWCFGGGFDLIGVSFAKSVRCD